MANCPFHGPDCRWDPRFDELDALIACGWGHVPSTRIEAAIKRNGGILPAAPGESETPADDAEFSSWAASARSRGVTKREIVLRAIEAGYSTSAEVAAATASAGITVEGASAAMNALSGEGKIEESGVTWGRHGHVMRMYRISDSFAARRAAASGAGGRS